MRIRHSCRSCDHAICRQCLVNIQIADLHSSSSTGLPRVRERFCLRCLLFVREQRRKRQSCGGLSRLTFHTELSSDSFYGRSGRSLCMSRASSFQMPVDMPGSGSDDFTPVVLTSGRVLSKHSKSAVSIAESDEHRTRRNEHFTTLYGRIAEQATILRRLQHEQQWRQNQAAGYQAQW